MTLLDAPRFDAARSQRNRNLLVAAGILVLAIAIVGVGGFFSGHGWFFDDLGVEHHVGKFLQAVQDNRLEDAYAIWRNDPNWKSEPPDQNYDFSKFKEDWGPQSQDGAMQSYKVLYSKRTGSGCIVAVRINGKRKPSFLWYEFKTRRMSFSPLELQF